MAPDEDDAWFAPKRYGYGSGLPIAWQGWALLAAYFIVILAASFLIARHPFAYAAILFVATALFIAIVAARTRGGWRWRSGEDD
jgi:hypothetical protein